MRKKPYLIDGIIGNGKMLLSLTKDGQIQRLNWPRIDALDQINNQWIGIAETGENQTKFFHSELFDHEQWYEQDSNVLVTKHSGEGLEVEQSDYALPSTDVWVREFEVTNRTNENKAFTFMYYSDSALESMNNFQTTKFDLEQDCLIHYYKNTAMSITSSLEISSYQAGKADQQAQTNQLEGRMILNNSEGAIAVELGEIAPGEMKKISFYISIATTEAEAYELGLQAKQLGDSQLRNQTNTYWLDILNKREKFSVTNESVEEIYKRSILTFHLLQNKETGAFIAGPEVDEDYDYSGGYAYCWGRDAAFIASAVDIAGYHESVSKFYRFVTRTQSPDGSWDQRHYTDGTLAPTWGMQVDEIGSIIWGINDHYQRIKDEQFRQEMWSTVKKGADFLSSFIDPETNLPLPSNDLWEKREGEHLYSTATVYGGLMGASALAELEQEVELAERYKNLAMNMKEAVQDLGWNEESGRYVRSLKRTVTKEEYIEAKNAGKKVSESTNAKGVTKYVLWEDTTPDISLLGLNYPFEMIGTDDEGLEKTAKAIEESCVSEIVGGILRFPGDVYIGGNPWLISTLWLAIYKLRKNDEEQAVDLFTWTTEHANHLNLLPEQIDKETNEPAWVMPLTWSHAMYVLTIKELAEKNLI